jgi:hypothetical protein
MAAPVIASVPTTTVVAAPVIVTIPAIGVMLTAVPVAPIAMIVRARGRREQQGTRGQRAEPMESFHVRSLRFEVRRL